MKTTNISTHQWMKYRCVPAHREQIMSELTHLENEKARLDREISIWLSNQKKAQIRIQQVQERIDFFLSKIEELLPKPQAAQSGQETKKQSGNFREVNLEY